MIDTTGLSDVQVLACTLYGEARSEPTEGILAVACVIRNRMKEGAHRWPQTYREVCLQPKQFSVWNDGPEKTNGVLTNHGRLMELVAALKAGTVTDERYKECAWIATGVFNDWVRDNVYGADHYHVAKMAERPPWTKGVIPLNNIYSFPRSQHLFYKLTPLVKPAKVAATA